jgi:hypothetical protein
MERAFEAEPVPLRSVAVSVVAMKLSLTSSFLPTLCTPPTASRRRSSGIVSGIQIQCGVVCTVSDSSIQLPATLSQYIMRTFTFSPCSCTSAEDFLNGNSITRRLPCDGFVIVGIGFEVEGEGGERGDAEDEGGGRVGFEAVRGGMPQN